MKFAATIAVATALVPSALAFCCDSNIYSNCADGTKGTPCCATRKCNIFCCSCGGRCRSKKRDLTTSFDVWQRDEVNTFCLADVGGKGNVTLVDYLSFRNVQGEPEIWV